MKVITKSFANYFLFVLVLCITIVSGCSCTAPKPTKPTPDPLAGFHWSSLVNLNANEAIKNDYNDYINQLSPQEQKGRGTILYWEDGTGQHAVQIEVLIGGKEDWCHILIYDKENKRIKTIKYYVGWIMS
jgi:hypothetical protein